MTAPNFQTNEELNEQNLDGADPIDSPEGGVNIEPQNTPPAPPAIDYAALYRESVAERRRLEEEAERLRQERSQPQNEEVEITDEYFEKHGTARGVAAIVENKVAKLLQQTLGDVGEISKDFKRTKQIASAEEKFFQEFPNLVGVKDPLTQEVRKFLSNAPNVDINTYRSTALSMIGALAAQSFNPGAAQPSQPSTTPTVPSAPAPRGGQQIRTPIRRLSEFERHAMRTNGYDPNKREDIDAFFALVERDGPVEI